MIIEFEVENFRSFRDKRTLSLVAGRLSDHAATHTFDAGIGEFPRLLRSAALYGPNASGKTNLLRAVQFLQFLVLNSARSTGDGIPNYSPFKLDRAISGRPSQFKITFVQNAFRYEYGLAVSAARVCREYLIEYVNPKGRVLFQRTYDDQRKTYDWKFSKFLKGRREVWRSSTRHNALFLSTAAQLNSEQMLHVFEWFQKRLVVIVDMTTMNATLTLNLLTDGDGKRRLLTYLREADPGIADVEARREAMPIDGGLVVAASGSHIIEQRAGQPPSLWRIALSHRGAQESETFLSQLNEESGGTQIMFQSAGAWLNVLQNGEVLFFDEIDKSLHPLLVAFLLAQFHNAEANKYNAQIVFSTHQPYLLGRKADLFRRDQIWFVDKDSRNASELYPLLDFKPRGDAAIEDNYLAGRFGALPFFHDLKP